MSVSCSGSSGATCVGRLTLTARVKTKHKVKGRTKTETKTVTLGSAAYRVAAGQSTTVTIKLSASNVKLLDSTPGHKLKAVASARPSTGAAVVKTVTLSGTAAKKKHVM